MDPSASTTPPSLPVSQRELLGLIMGCAARTSATFNQAEFTLIAASAGPDVRTLTRELLNDLAIRGWIELRRRLPTGASPRSSAPTGRSSSPPSETGTERRPTASVTRSPRRGATRLWGRAGR